MTRVIKLTVAFMLVGSWLSAVARAEDPAESLRQPQTSLEPAPYLSESQESRRRPGGSLALSEAEGCGRPAPAGRGAEAYINRLLRQVRAG